MKRQATLITLLMLLQFCSFAYVNTTWQELPMKNVPTNGERKIFPEEYRLYRLNQQYINDALYNAAAEPTKAVTIAFPTPLGTMANYRVWQNNTMSPGLKEKFPEIRTFTAISVDNPEVSARITVSPKGISAMVWDKVSTYIIDPYSTANDGYYIVYEKRAVAQTYKGISCSVTDKKENEVQTGKMILDNEPPKASYKTHGTQKKTFYLALSCTGEYAQAVNGTSPTLANVLAAMTNTINRVNGILERELCVTLELISNTNQLVYLDPVSDPFTTIENNNINGATQSANQTNTDNVIGTTYYDIGHVFCSGIGGIADYEGLCKGSMKARAATGSANPIGDPFDVDYVVHEIGHQLGAEHTFNYNSGSCSPHARVESAYEPGSGTSIMAYAGLCSGNNIQNNSDDYFHARSMDQITEYISTTNPILCGYTNSLANTPPSVPSVLGSYEIPCHTPFELEAPLATDNDNDYINYCWELYDLGDFGKSISATQFGPTIRSFKPTISRWRIFPVLDSVRVGVNSYFGEKMPDVTRNLNFRLTVRDFYNGLGSYNWSDTTVALHAHIQAGPFKLTQPNQNSDYWKIGNSYTVTWDVANSNNAPVNCSNVDIYLSLDNGETWPHILASGTANDGSETITAPAGAHTAAARVKVKGTGNVFFDMSDRGFIINDWPDAISEIATNNNVEIYPNPANGSLKIRITDGGQYNGQIVNSIGQTIWQNLIDGSATISTSAYAAGIYQLILFDKENGAKQVKRIVVQ